MTDLLAQLTQALVDRYTVQRQLGRGGMATVFLAQDLRHDRPVALKVLHPELSASLGPERFQREIKLAARLQHPHILTVLDSGEAAGYLWFTMPYVEGESLRDRLVSQKQLAVDEVVRLGRECALALDYAHRHGVIHRDIKPENILLIDGQAMVADFGIARALTGGDSLTETGLTVGTPAYMSPEQASGERELDARTDIYSLGCVVYEMLVGEPPFTGAIPQTIIARRFTETPRSIRAVRGGVPSGVEHSVMKALERVPADRFSTAAEFAKALEAGGRPERPSSGQQAPASPSLVPPVPAFRSKAAPLQRPVLLLLFGFALGLGVLFAWRRAQVNNVADKGPKRLAVLPFENLGDSADSYFADGVTDAVRGKLTGIPGLQVTARGSSTGYRHSEKSPRQIAQELGVQYLLTGTVRWEKQRDGGSKVQVSPELIEAATSASKWQQPFDASLTDVFQVQADIAGRVAQALNVALGSTEREQLAERPTQNIAAYEAFLQGEAASDALGSVDVPSLRRALGLYQQAVALDSGFALAWYRIARCNVLIYNNSTPTPETAAAALEAANRALTLGPSLPQSFHAMGSYYSIILGDRERAIQEYEQGLRLDPHNAELLTALGQIEQNLGRWESAIQHLQEAQKVDPRAVDTQRRLSRAFLWTRRYADALAAADRGLALSPTNTEILETKAMVHLAQGDLSGARMVIQSAPAEMTPIRKVADFANYWDLYWALDEADQQLVLRLRASEFDDNVAAWATIRAQLYRLRGDQLRAKAYADTARAEFVRQIASTPKDPQLHVIFGLALAILGRGDEAIREAKKGIELRSDDKFVGLYYRLQLARIYTMSGHADEAITTLEPLIEEPFYLSKDWLKIDPNFDPLRSNPRFQKLVAGTV